MTRIITYDLRQGALDSDENYRTITPFIDTWLYRTVRDIDDILTGFRQYRQLRKIIKTKGAFPNADAARKLMFLANRDIFRKWTNSVVYWPMVLNQLAIRFEDRLSF